MNDIDLQLTKEQTNKKVHRSSLNSTNILQAIDVYVKPAANNNIYTYAFRFSPKVSAHTLKVASRVRFLVCSARTGANTFVIVATALSV